RTWRWRTWTSGSETPAPNVNAAPLWHPLGSATGFQGLEVDGRNRSRYAESFFSEQQRDDSFCGLGIGVHRAIAIVVEKPLAQRDDSVGQQHGVVGWPVVTCGSF